MEDPGESWRRLQWRPGGRGWLLIGMLSLLLTASGWLSLERSKARLALTVHPLVSGQLQVFFEETGSFSEALSVWYPLAAGHSRELVLERTDSHLSVVRIDPPAGGEVALCDVRLTVAGTDHGYAAGSPHDAGLADTGRCLVMTSAIEASDPQLLLRADPAVEAAFSKARLWGNIHRAIWCLGALLVLTLLIGLRWIFLAPIRRFARLIWLERLDARATWVCAALMLVFGGMYALRTPPGAVPDEGAHLAKIAKIREGAPFGGGQGAIFPHVTAMYGPFSNYLDNRRPFTEQQLRDQMAQPLVCTPTTRALPVGADPYFPHHYALATGVFSATCAMGGSFGAFLHTARLLNLSLATFLVGIGIAFAARARWILVFVALLPMSISQMASLSADSLVIALSIAWVGVTSGLAAGHVSVRRVWPLLWVLAISIGLLKPGAAWILASLLLCRRAFRESGISFMRGLLCFVALPWVMHLLLITMVGAEGIARSGVEPGANLRSLVQTPLTFIALLWNTLHGEHGAHLYRMMIGILGWIDVPLSDWAYALAGSALFAGLFLGGDRPDTLRWSVVAPGALVIACGSILLIALPLYVQWTAPDATIVQGLQGRYFLPTLAFAGAWLSMRSPDLVRAILLTFVLTSVVALNIDAASHLHHAYFVSGR